jgi:hypothetical protein
MGSFYREFGKTKPPQMRIGPAMTWINSIPGAAQYLHVSAAAPAKGRATRIAQIRSGRMESALTRSGGLLLVAIVATLMIAVSADFGSRSLGDHRRRGIPGSSGR